MELGRRIKYDILIQASANNGFIAKVGCATFVFADDNSLLKGLREYLDNSEGHEEQYNKLPGSPVAVTTGLTPGPQVEEMGSGTRATVDENMPQSLG